MLHVGEVQGILKVGDKVVARIDSKRRYRIEANHTMTHILNYALREVSTSLFRNVYVMRLSPREMPFQCSVNC